MLIEKTHALVEQPGGSLADFFVELMAV